MPLIRINKSEYSASIFFYFSLKFEKAMTEIRRGGFIDVGGENIH